jgi:hypothetical protein
VARWSPKRLLAVMSPGVCANGRTMAFSSPPGSFFDRRRSYDCPGRISPEGMVNEEGPSALRQLPVPPSRDDALRSACPGRPLRMPRLPKFRRRCTHFRLLIARQRQPRPTPAGLVGNRNRLEVGVLSTQVRIPWPRDNRRRLRDRISESARGHSLSIRTCRHAVAATGMR